MKIYWEMDNFAAKQLGFYYFYRMKTDMRIKNYYITLSWTVIMFYLLFSPSSGLPKTGLITIPNFDKLVHFGMFGILAFAYLFDSENAGIGKNKTIIRLFTIAVFFGALSELVQFLFIKGREGSVFDFIADLTGLICGLLTYFVIGRKLLSNYIKSNNKNSISKK